jgi:phage tail protein X
MISVTASKTTILPGEIVRFTGYADPVEDIIMDAYVEGVRIAECTIYLKTLGINYIDIKPSLYGDVVVFYPRGAESGATAPPITITTVVSPPGTYSLTLSASKTKDINPGEIVTFTVTSSPPANLRATLYAYVGGVLVAEYGVSIVNGVGRESLVPSELGNVVDWQVEDEYGDRSNIVTTEVKTAPPGTYSLTLSASKTKDIRPDEVVTFTLKVSPAVTYVAYLYAYVEGKVIGVWNMNVINGVAKIDLVPSALADSIDWIAMDAYGNRSNTVTTTLMGAAAPPSAPPATYSLTLSASKTRDIERDEVVTFTLRVSPAVTYVATLYAFVSGREVGRWSMYVADGVASIALVPSLLGDIVDWYAVDTYGNKSNTVTTTLKGVAPPAPPIGWAVPLLIIGGLMVLAAEEKKRG